MKRAAAGRALRPADPDRTRVAGRLARRSVFERTVLALLFVERMTPAEVAAVVGLTAADVVRAAERLIASLSEGAPAPIPVPVTLRSERRDVASRRRAA